LRRYLVLLLILFLAACRPPAVDPVDPFPPSPAPVVIVEQLAGEWLGVIRATEGFFFNVVLRLDELGSSVTGLAYLVDEPVETVGIVTGVRDGERLRVTVVATADGETVTLVFVGVASGGAFVGTVALLGAEATFVFGRVR
jgi:hypothetical protein